MKNTYHYAYKFAIWCLVLALPYYLLAPKVFDLLGASSHMTFSIWERTYNLDGIQILSFALFSYIAFITWPQNPLRQKSKQDGAANPPPLSASGN